MRYFEICHRVGNNVEFSYFTARELESSIKKFLPDLELLEITKEAYAAGKRSLCTDGLRPVNVYSR